MMRIGKTLSLTLGSLLLGHSVIALTADSSASPYRGIVDRNVFDVHPAPLQPLVPPVPPGPPPPAIKLQGITDILGRKQVLFKAQVPPKSGQPAKEESFILTVGERQGEFEVLDINPKAGTVIMRNYGVVTNLSLDANSDKLINTAPVTAPIGIPAPAPAAPGAMAPPPTLPSLPQGRFPRTLRLPGSAGAQPNAGSPNYGGTSFGSSSSVDPNDQSRPQAAMSPEARALLIEAQRQKYKAEGNPLANILPPTSATPRNEDESPSTPQLP